MTASKVLNKTAGDIIAEALRSSRIIASEQPIEAVDYEAGLIALNNISKYWQAEGVHLWLQGRAVLALNPGQEMYILGPDGDPVGNYEDFVQTTLSVDQLISDVELTVASTVGMVPAPNILDTDPTDSTQGWTALNSATLAVVSGLRATNVGATQGGATYSLASTIGTTYRVKFTYTLGTSVSCIFSVLNATTVEDTVTLTASGSNYLEITAAADTIIFKFQNSSAVAGQTSTVLDVEYVDIHSGSIIGTQLTSNERDWDHVYTVDSLTEVTLVRGLLGAAASTNTVYSFPEQIARPLELNNVTFSSQFSNSEIPTTNWSRQEYFNQPDKNSQGAIVQWYYNPTLNNGRLYVWQTASNINNILRFDIRIPLSVYDQFTDELDFPDEYYTALKWAIAAELGPDYGVPENRQMVLEAKAAKFLQMVLDNDAEESSLFFQPDLS